MAKRLVGLDIGYCHVRAIALTRRGRSWHVLGSAAVSRFDDQGQRKPLQRSLTELGGRLSLKGYVVLASSDLATMVRFSHTDPMPADRLERVLRMELVQHSPDDQKDLAADAIAVPLDGDDIIHCCGLAQPDQVLELLDECKQAGIAVDRVQLAPGATGGILRSFPPPEDDKFDLVVDIGGRSTRVVLARGDDLVACRQLPIGGDQFTEALAKARRIRFEQAERAKQSGDYQTIHGKATTVAASAIAITAVDEPAVDDSSIELGDLDTAATDEVPLSFGVSNAEQTPPADADQPGADSDEVPLSLELTDGGVDDAASASASTDDGMAPSLDVADTAASSPALSFSPPAEADDGLALEATDDGLSLEDPSPAAGHDTLSLTDDSDAAPVDEPPLQLTGDASPVDGAESPSDASSAAPVAKKSVRLPMATNRDGSPSWQRDTTGFDLDEPDVDVPAAGNMTQMIGGTVLGPELVRVADDIHAQLTKTMVWLQAQLKRRELPLGRVKLVGAGADLAGLVPYLQRRFGVPVTVADPLSHCEGEPPSHGHHFAAAFGLAVAGAGDAPLWDLRPESLQVRSVRRQLVWPPRIAAALFAAAAITGGVGLWRSQSADAERLALYENHKRAYQTAEQQRQQLDVERDAIVTDLTGIAGRIFAGRDLLYTIRALKENAPRSLWITHLETRPAEVESNQRDGGGRSLRGGERTSNGPEPIPDTALDRGMVVLRGIVRTEAGQDFSLIVGSFNEWNSSIETWTLPDDPESRLFRDYEPVLLPFDRENADEAGDFAFEFHYYFEPTSLVPTVDPADDGGL